MLNLYRRAPRSSQAVLLVGLAFLAGGCASRLARLPVRAFDAVVPRTGRTYAVLINGGGRPSSNYQSHLRHVKTVVRLLEANGVPPEDIAVFSGDGDDPKADLATREVAAEPELWLLPSAGVGGSLRPPIVYVNSAIDGIRLRPARKETLRAWFERRGAWLRPGDTLLFYVTDHGHKNAKDLTNNTIVLWGEELSVRELRDLLALLDPGVRVVMLMSECYGGAFAHAIFREGEDTLPAGNVCGYFASTADRQAYGCYPENRGKNGVGHSFQFLKALGPLGRFPEANQRVLLTDRTPDVPHTSTDFFLDQLLRRKAQAAGQQPEAFVDNLLAEAWENRAAWEPEIRLLDRIGHTFGSFSPRSLAELQEQARVLPDFSKQLKTYAARWKQALEALKVENFQRFLDAHKEWRPRLDAKKLKHFPADARLVLAGKLLTELVPFTKADRVRYTRLLSLKQKAHDAAAAHYRTEVRLGAVLRMRTLLTSIAGRVYLASHATPAERAAFTRLHACEDLALTAHPAVASAAALETPASFPPLADEEHLIKAVTPAWMGIRYSQLTAAQRKRYGVQKGAVRVVTVYPDSPAAAAHLKVGDVIVGPPAAPFVEPNQVREWTMRSEINAPKPLQILRDEHPLRVTLRLGPYPLRLPKLPGPPKVGSTAPPLKVDVVRGAKRLAAGEPRLLFFWATWCTICKTALPEVLAFSQARDIDVLAITDEDPEKVQKFFQTFHKPFPGHVATDQQRITFHGYGVSGIPTFVLIDADGVVRHYKTGYTRKAGLGIEGWHWHPELKQASSRAPSRAGSQALSRSVSAQARTKPGSRNVAVVRTPGRGRISRT